MTNRTESAPGGWLTFDRLTLAALRMCAPAMLKRVVEGGIAPAAGSAAFHLAKSLDASSIVVGPVAWVRHAPEIYKLMVRDRLGRLWIGELAKIDGARIGWFFATVAGPFDPDLDGDQVDPRNFERQPAGEPIAA